MVVAAQMERLAAVRKCEHGTLPQVAMQADYEDTFHLILVGSLATNGCTTGWPHAC